ncbi:MAG: HAMP domain-containing histidine kinase, partial [Myxococcales bacterium]|nr:HAMP domain-containing histidine kinase [Myxococcales bacterium]
SREAEQMGVLMGEVKRLGGILDEFLNLSRPADGLNASAQDPAALVQDVARLYAATSRERAVDLQVDCAPCGAVRCDPRKVRQVLINLVENALQHSPAGGTVVLALAERAGAAVFTVRDLGPGPSAQAAERAFEAGFTTRPEGTGLGLTVARAIAHQHGGELRLTAAAPGALATLTLPLEPPA